MARTSLNLGKTWERNVPFSLSVVASGKSLYTAGITSRDDEGQIVGENDMRQQVAQCFANLGAVLEATGTTWGNVVKYTIYTTDIEDYAQNTGDIRS